MPSRRTSNLSLPLAGMLAAGLIAASACNDSSNMVTSPGSGATAAVNVTGTWTGTFHSGVAGCSAVPVVANLTQTGDKVTGSVTTTSCGLSSGHLNGMLTGHSLTGSMGMQGCTGGALSGTVNGAGNQISFSMDDLKKPLVTGDQVVAPGGDITLTK